MISYLENLFDLDTLKAIFSEAKKNLKFRRGPNYDYHTAVGFASVIGNTLKEGSIFHYDFKNVKYSAKFTSKNDFSIHYDFYQATDIVLFNGGKSPTFDNRDFFDMIILNIETYKRLKEIKN